MKRRIIVPVLAALILTVLGSLWGTASDSASELLQDEIVDYGLMGYFVPETFVNHYSERNIELFGLEHMKIYYFAVSQIYGGKVQQQPAEYFDSWYETTYDENGMQIEAHSYWGIAMQEDYFDSHFTYGTMITLPVYETEQLETVYDFASESEIQVILCTNYNESEEEYRNPLNIESLDENLLKEMRGTYGDYILKDHIADVDFLSEFGNMAVYHCQVVHENSETGAKEIYVACDKNDYDLLSEHNLCGLRGGLLDYGLTYEGETVYFLKNLYTQTYYPNLNFYNADDILSWNAELTAQDTTSVENREAEQDSENDSSSADSSVEKAKPEISLPWIIGGVLVIGSVGEGVFVLIRRKQKRNEAG